MIIGDLKNLVPYKAMSNNMKLAIEYLEEIDMTSMVDGKHPVVGDDIFVVMSTYFTREHDESKYEIHHNYIDIQYLIKGEEIIFCNEAHEMEREGDYNPKNDKLNFKDQLGAVSIHMKPGMAAIFYPNDAHKACCKVHNKIQEVRKLLVKVKMED
ncbi:YhcH/YjgK/YiaL family protein [Marinisporobacter balticus]|uniref:YhcH/YjgK/YiaL family protein n=1 Tax=Marinisporobacter balticus TaxID=2018667 RepID=A0A4R2KVB9_9FIRM|nr:YhcH/YjgK/YiaL family protein [Marinisporobacter balticus]TCO76872.1 YhcH/YjgK/YiaL family protein [Marinisporobacter balticus]